LDRRTDRAKLQNLHVYTENSIITKRPAQAGHNWRKKMKYYDRLEQYMGDDIIKAKAELIKFAVPKLGGCEVLFNESGMPVAGFNWRSDNKPGRWYNID
jgi:hypothetical protein